MDEIQRLEFADVILWLHTKNALTALATKHLLNWQFYGRPEEERIQVYKTNVANSYLYQANEAVIERSIVGIVEHVRSENQTKLLPIPKGDLEELRKHRVVVSHPSNVKFKDPVVQKFYDDKSQYRDPTAKRIWRIRQALLEELTKLGSKRSLQFPNQVDIQLGTCELIHNAISITYKPEISKPSLKEVWSLTPQYFKKFEKSLSKPD